MRGVRLLVFQKLGRYVYLEGTVILESRVSS